MTDDWRDTAIFILTVAIVSVVIGLQWWMPRMHQVGDYAVPMDLPFECEMTKIVPPWQPRTTIVLLCSGVDGIRLWPMPVQYPWSEDGE